jgi:hypothetical protein
MAAGAVLVPVWPRTRTEQIATFLLPNSLARAETRRYGETADSEKSTGFVD